MSLEEKLHQKPKIVRRKYPSAEALSEVERGKKFIVVEDDFEPSLVPQGYTLIDMKHKGQSFRTLVPQSLLFYMVNPGEGNPEDALDEIADFYEEAEDFEDEQIENGETNVQEANWAGLARGNYQTYLINRLVRHKKGANVGIEPVPEFNEKVIDWLDINESYVAQRAKAIAALALGKTAEQIKIHEVKDVLKHVTVATQKKEIKARLTREEFERVACYAGSHYEIKPKFRKQGYEIRGDELYKVRQEETLIKKPILDAKIGELESEIESYRKAKHGETGRHDTALIRQYINLAHIAPENPHAQLDIVPPAQDTKNFGNQILDKPKEEK